MRQITSQLRAVATRRRLIDAATLADADLKELARHTRSTLRHSMCWAETWATRVALMAPFAQQPAPRTPQTTPTPRMSTDFTSQVMARLSAPPPDPDPREAQAKRRRARMRRLARMYMTLVMIGAAGLLLAFALDHALLLNVVEGAVGLTVVVAGFAELVSRLTGGAISGIGVLYVVMLVVIAPPIVVAAWRSGRGRTPSSPRL